MRVHDPGRNVAHRLPQQPRHFGDHRVRSAVHRLRFGYQVPGIVKDPVDPAGLLHALSTARVARVKVNGGTATAQVSDSTAFAP
jgi:hypothetical protein